MLKELAPRYSFTVTAIDALGAPDGARYSSTATRDFLKEGKPQDAAHYPRAVLGDRRTRREHGAQARAHVGLPRPPTSRTATICIPRKAYTPIRAGVDKGAGHCVALTASRISATGPTFDHVDVLLEAHLFDFNERPLRQTLARSADRLHSPRAGNSMGLDSLKAQIARGRRYGARASGQTRVPSGCADAVRRRRP